MKNCFYADYFKSYLPTRLNIFCIFSKFKGGLYALDILKTALLPGYTMIAHSV